MFLLYVNFDKVTSKIVGMGRKFENNDGRVHNTQSAGRLPQPKGQKTKTILFSNDPSLKKIFFMLFEEFFKGCKPCIFSTLIIIP